MTWYQNSFLLHPTDHRLMQSKGDRYTLNIRNFQTSDFGNYRYAYHFNFKPYTFHLLWRAIKWRFQFMLAISISYQLIPFTKMVSWVNKNAKITDRAFLPRSSAYTSQMSKLNEIEGKFIKNRSRFTAFMIITVHCFVLADYLFFFRVCSFRCLLLL